MNNVQIYPSKILCVPNDIFSKRLFNLGNDDYQQALAERKTLEVVEKKNHYKFGDVITPFRIRVDDNADFTLSEPLDQFDFAVLCACISEWQNKNRFTTPSIIYRAVSGKVGDYDANPSKIQLTDILQSVDKLMRTQIGINMTKACENLKYNGGTAFKVVSAILPCKRVTDTTVNGQTSTIISFDRESPLWEIAAKVKNHQVLSCDAELLNVPGQQNTRMNVAVKFYVLRRVLEIKWLPPSLSPTFLKNAALRARAAIKNAMPAMLSSNLSNIFKTKSSSNHSHSKKKMSRHTPFFSRDKTKPPELRLSRKFEK